MDTIHYIDPYTKEDLNLTPEGLCNKEQLLFPFVNGSYRITQTSNYTSSFGFQWNKFEKTQIDRIAKGVLQSRERFFAATRWDTENLQGSSILEVGSGAGRFSQVILEHTQGTLYSVDYSNAVEANFRNNGANSRLKLFQASIYELPFAPTQFDKVFCFGVLQHTPDVERSVQCLINMVKPGGELIVDFYPIRGWYSKVHAKYLFRPFTKKMNHVKLLSYIESNVDGLIRAYRFFDKIGVGKLLNRFLPLCDINTTLPKNLDEATLRHWIILDTFDMFSPAYDQPQKQSTVVSWFKKYEMKEVQGLVINYGDGNQVTIVKGKK